jgi:hypothetical protein
VAVMSDRLSPPANVDDYDFYGNASATCGRRVACSTAHANAKSATSSHPFWAGIRCDRPENSLTSVIVFDL